MMLPKPNDGFAWVQTPGGAALVCRALQPFANHLFTTRAWTLGSASGLDAGPAWGEVARALGVDRANLVRAHQVHGASVLVRRASRGAPHPAMPDDLPDADILVSDDAGLALAIQAADCVPLLIADRRTGVVAAAHAGWRGLAARVPMVAVEALTREFGSRPADLVAAIGPSISAARYEVGVDVRERFAASGCSRAQMGTWFADAARPSHWQFDGRRSARDLLEAAGVPAAEIYASGLCTASHPELLCSYRRDGMGAGRVAGAIRAIGARNLVIWPSGELVT
jgi:polyphenol oxidase